MSKLKPVLFSAPMVFALRARRKTQTRRMVKLNAAGRVARGGRNWHVDDPNAIEACPYGKPGDLLWVRESWARGSAFAIYREGSRDRPSDNTDEWNRPHDDRWLPSIHMPKDVCRFVLRVSEVRLQLLQGITADDAIAEGLLAWPSPAGGVRYGINLSDVWESDPRATYARLWDHINGEGSWAVNPRVWAVTFEIIATTKVEAQLVLREASVA